MGFPDNFYTLMSSLLPVEKFDNKTCSIFFAFVAGRVSKLFIYPLDHFSVD